MSEKMQPGQEVIFPPFRLDPVNQRLWKGSHPVQLRPKTFAVLCHLAARPGQLVTKEALLDAVWSETYVSQAVPIVCVRELRVALGDDANAPRFVETVPRRGYRFIAKIREQRADGREPTPLEHGISLMPLPSAPLSSVTPHFVGRETELSRLQAGLEQAIQGQRQVLFVSGEAGIGKTTLIDGFLDQARSTGGAWIGRGLCVEHYGVGETYLPVLDALGRLCRDPAGKHFLSLLGRFAPTWLVQMPTFLDAAELDALQRRTQGVSQERMLREMAEALEALTSDTPLILVLEDLQWSDYSTLDFVSFLARRREPARVFLIGTYRPGEVRGGHPLMRVKQELQAHGQSEELPLTLLTEEVVGSYLSKRFPGPPLPPGLAQAVYQRTEGNPLFMVSLANDFPRQGVVSKSAAGWVWPAQDKDNISGVPENLEQLIEKQIEQLSQEEQHVLEAASVAGLEFSVAALAAGIDEESRLVEERCTALARRGQFLLPRGVSEWPDGTLAGRYGFIHSLYQDVLLERLTPGQRLDLQRRIGERKEAAYGPRSGEIAAELAVHFEEGRDYPRAIQYLQHAAENARRRWAYHEAVSRLTKGLGLLHHLPDTPERTQQELQLHFMLTEPLVAMKGAAAPEVEQSYTQTRELYQQLGKTAQPFWVLLGLWGVHFIRSELQQASELAEQLFELAEQEQAPLFLYWAQHARALTTLYRGDLLTAHAQFEQAIGMYDAQSHPRYMIDPKVICLSHTALVLWLLGYPDQAVKKNQAALARARRLDNPLGLACALDYAAGLYIALHEQAAAHEFAESVTELALKQGFPHYVALGTIQQGWVRLDQGDQGDIEVGIAMMRQGISAYRATGAKLVLTSILPLVAGAYGRIGQPEEGLRILEEALAEMQDGGELWFEAAVYTVKGELLLQSGVTDSNAQSNLQAEAQDCFQQAIRIAQRQGAKSLELRATLSLCRVWQQSGKSAQARQHLADVYDWFSEGFETADLREARALLQELG